MNKIILKFALYWLTLHSYRSAGYFVICSLYKHKTPMEFLSDSDRSYMFVTKKKPTLTELR